MSLPEYHLGHLRGNPTDTADSIITVVRNIPGTIIYVLKLELYMVTKKDEIL